MYFFFQINIPWNHRYNLKPQQPLTKASKNYNIPTFKVTKKTTIKTDLMLVIPKINLLCHKWFSSEYQQSELIIRKNADKNLFLNDQH